MLERFLVIGAVVLMFIASQIFWVRQIGKWGSPLIPGPTWRRRVSIAGLVFYLLLLFYNFPGAERSAEATHLTLRAALLQAPFGWWIICSVVGFLIAIPLGLADRIASAARWVYQRVVQAGRAIPLPSPVSLARRRFLEKTAQIGRASCRERV